MVFSPENEDEFGKVSRASKGGRRRNNGEDDEGSAHHDDALASPAEQEVNITDSELAGAEAVTSSGDDEVSAADQQSEKWKRIVDRINHIRVVSRQEKDANLYLQGAPHKGIQGAVEQLNAVEAELATMQDERILTRTEIERKRQLENEFHSAALKEARAKRDSDIAARNIDAMLDLVVRDFVQLPEELQGAIRTTDEKILQQYGVNVWSSQEVRGEMFRRERENRGRKHHWDSGKENRTEVSQSDIVGAANDEALERVVTEGLAAIVEAERLATQFPGVYEVKDGGGIVNAETGVRVDAPAINPPGYGESAQDSIKKAKIVYHSEPNANHPDGKLTAEHLRVSEREALGGILKAGAPKTVLYPPVDSRVNSALTGVYVEGQEGGISGLSLGEGGTETLKEIPLPPIERNVEKKEKIDFKNISWEQVDELLSSKNQFEAQQAKLEWERRERHDLKYAAEKEQGTYGALKNTLQAIEFNHGGTVPARWLLAFQKVPAVARYLRAHPIVERPEIVNLREVNIEERYNRAHGITAPATLDAAPTEESAPVAKSGEEKSPETKNMEKYALSFLSSTDEEIEMRPGILFAYLTPEEVRAFNEISAVSMSDKNTENKRIKIMEHHESEGNDSAVSTYLCAFEGSRLTHHVRVSMTPNPGATIFDEGKIIGSVKEVHTPEEKAQKANEAREQKFADVIAVGAAAHDAEKAAKRALTLARKPVAPVVPTKVVAAVSKEASEAKGRVETPSVTLSAYDKAIEENWSAETRERFAAIPKNWTLSPMSTERDAFSIIPPEDVSSLLASTLEAGHDITSEETIPSREDAAARSLELAAMATNPEAPTPTPDFPKTTTSETAPKEVDARVAKLFETKFGILEEELGVLPVFSALSPEKQLLVLRNLEQLTFTDIKKEARETQKKEWENLSGWQRGLQGLLLKPVRRIAELEKELLAKARGTNDNRIDDIRRLSIKLGHIESLAQFADAGPDVVVEGGEMRINYVSRGDLFESLEDKRLTGEHLLALENFNKTATAFAKIPHEWLYESTDVGRGDRKTIETSRQNFENARATLLEVFAKKFTADGVENANERAMLQMNALDERVAMNQLQNAHPDAETALSQIEHTPAWKIARNEFMKARGTFMLYGAMTRGAAVAAAGILASPLLAVAAIPLGVAAAGAVGYGIGKNEGNELMRAKRVSGRMSEEDEREEFEYDAPIYEDGEKKKIKKNEKGHELYEVKTRKLKEFTDSSFFTDRIARLTLKLEETTDAKEKELLEKKVAQTTMLMAAKFRKGMINFGGSSLDVTDARKGEVLANQLSFVQALHRGALMTMVDQGKMKDEAERLTGLRQNRVEETRKKTVIKTAVKSAIWRAGFALTGVALARWLPDALSGKSAPTKLAATPVALPKIPPIEALDEIVAPPKSAPPVIPINPLHAEIVPEAHARELPKDAVITPPPNIKSPVDSVPVPHSVESEAAGKLRNPLLSRDAQFLKSEAASVVTRGTEEVRIVALLEKEVGRKLSPDEGAVIKNLTRHGMVNVRDYGELARIGGFKHDLLSAMKENSGPLSSIQLYELLKLHHLEIKVKLPESDELLKHQFGLGGEKPTPVHSPNRK